MLVRNVFYTVGGIKQIYGVTLKRKWFSGRQVEIEVDDVISDRVIGWDKIQVAPYFVKETPAADVDPRWLAESFLVTFFDKGQNWTDDFKTQNTIYSV